MKRAPDISTSSGSIVLSAPIVARTSSRFADLVSLTKPRMNVLVLGTAALGLFTLLSYIFLYTPLKRITSLNTVVGAIPGAIPAVMGFTAVDGALSAQAMSLFGILFLWQMPHFLAIAILYKNDYAAGGFKMLPVVDPALRMTSRMIVL